MMAKDYKKFIQTHKNNFWNNLRLGRKGREWVDKYTDELCDSREDCPGCPAEQWCDSADNSWFAWTHPWFIISIHIKNWLKGYMWDWYQKHPCKKIQTCSCCGLKERGSHYYLTTYAGWRKEHHKWVCHHCWGHAFDDINYDTQKDIPHEDYEKQWKNYVKEHNKGV